MTSLRRTQVLILQGSSAQDSELGEILSSEPALQLTTVHVAHDQAVQTVSSAHPDVIILAGVHANILTTINELDEHFGSTPIVVVLPELEADGVQACLLNGARVCLVQPLDADELISTILQVHDKAVRRRQFYVDSPATPRGRLIAVRGTKGGVGTTTTAVNLAVALHQQTRTRVALVDGHLFSGDVSAALNITHNRSVSDLVAHVAHVDDDLIATTLAEHPSGIAVLSAPVEFEQADTITANHFRNALDALCQRYQYVVVDCAAAVDQITLATMDASDLLLLVTTPELAALKNASRLIQLGVRLGYPESKLRLVVNRDNMAGAISASDFEQHLDYRASFRLPQDSAVVGSLTRGEPLVTASRSSSAARAFANLARAASNNDGWLGEREVRKAPIARLLGWRPARTAEAA